MTWLSHFLPGTNPKGTPILSVLAKRTYALSQGSVCIADKQIPFIEADIYADPNDFFYSEVIAETDLVAYKPFTDIVIIGKAKTPQGKQAYHLDVSLKIGGIEKTIRVFGERSIESRTLRGVSITDPKPFSEITIGYKNAFGGIAMSKNGTLFSFPPNPIGKGFTLKGGLSDISQAKVPNIEDPSSPLSGDIMICNNEEDWTKIPKPVSLGYTRRNFFPRYTYAGIMPEQMAGAGAALEEHKKNNPAFSDVKIPSMDFRMFQAASEGLWAKDLQGNEPVRINYMDQQYPTFEFTLPGDVPHISLEYNGETKELPAVLQTVVIDKEQNIMTMVWRGSMEYGGIETLAEIPVLGFSAESAKGA